MKSFCPSPLRVLSLLLLISCLPALGLAREFTVLVYNVENLFDIDGTSLFDEYVQDPAENPHPYGPGKLLVKVENIARALQYLNNGKGPEVILFQEFELDRSPASTMNPEAFLTRFEGHSVADLLADPDGFGVTGMPVELFVLKHLDDLGMSGYEIALPPVKPEEIADKKAHTNVVFSRFPILEVRGFPTEDARDIQEVVLEVEGHRLVLLNNHWKSGASNPRVEPTRIENARTLRSRLDEILAADPEADIIIGGDLNSHYNQIHVVRGLEITGVNTILKSQGDEVALAHGKGPDLYNLWFELPPAERGSEVWGGRWGTLMQILLTRGLYDFDGVQYVDNSFFRLKIPGVNVDATWGAPLDWVGVGAGGGFSDHLAIGARFRIVEEGDRERVMELTRPGIDDGAFVGQATVPYHLLDRKAVKSTEVLEGLSEAELGQRFGEVFRFTGELTSVDPFRLMIGEREFGLWSFDRDVRRALEAHGPDTPVRFYGELGSHRGQIQLVIVDRSWIEQPLPGRD